MLILQPADMLGDDGRTIAIDADPKRVAPLLPRPM
jgi:hypothetical protein